MADLLPPAAPAPVPLAPIPVLQPPEPVASEVPGQLPASPAIGPPVLPGTADWKAGLPDEMRANPGLADIADVNGLAQQVLDLQAYQGTSIRLPGPDATPETRAEFLKKLGDHVPELIPAPQPDDKEGTAALWKHLGRPDEATGYKVPEVEGADSDKVIAAMPDLFALGLTQSQFDGIVALDVKRQGEAQAGAASSLQAGHAELHAEWGLTYEPRVARAKAFAAKSGAPAGLVEAIGANAVDALTIKWLHSLSEAVGTEGLQMGAVEGGAEPGAIPPADALARATECLEAMVNMRPNDPRYQALMDKRMMYMKMADPKAQTDLNNLRANVEPITAA